MTQQTPYQILGVSQDDDMTTVKRAWRALCFSSHPDKAGQTAEAHENFIRIRKAYESICKNYNKPNISSDKTNRYRPSGKEKPWHETGSENNYQAKSKDNIQVMSQKIATYEIQAIDFNLLLLSVRADAFFIRYAIVCPQSEKSTWAELHRCLQSLKATSKEVKTLASRTSNKPKKSWAEDGDQTRVTLATISRLRVKCDRMAEVQG
ncbi:hypothetical protein F4679DRAFT_597109 [Xylaria curta]|nr:hypothetical protein F4679DRAFT_597109 [Xylaria curta]